MVTIWECASCETAFPMVGRSEWEYCPFCGAEYESQAREIKLTDGGVVNRVR